MSTPLNIKEVSKYYIKKYSIKNKKELNKVFINVDNEKSYILKQNTKFMIDLYYELDKTLFAHPKLDKLRVDDIVIFKFEKHIYVFSVDKCLPASESVIRPYWNKWSKYNTMIYLKNMYKI